MPNTCAVTGNVKNLLGQNVQNCTVKASVLTPFFHTGGWISGEVASTATDSSGNFSISVVETETVGTKITFTFEYNDGTAGIKRRAYTVVVPDDATASLSDLVSAPVSPVTFNTLAAQYVTVAAISNLAATQAQAAFAELQADIDTRALGADLDTHIADTTAAHAASAISFTAGGTIAGTDVQTAVAEVATDAASALSTHEADTSTHGVTEIVGRTETQTLTNKTIAAGSNTITGLTNTNVDAAAAIAYSKLNLATSILNADVNASAAIARSKLASIVKHQVRLRGGNGHGSTSTKIRRYATTLESTGTAITYADSASLGATFTINEAGVYAITLSDLASAGGGAAIGITLNDTELTTNLYSKTNNGEIITSTNAAGNGFTVALAATLYLAANDVIRVHDDGAFDQTDAVQVRFNIVKVSE